MNRYFVRSLILAVVLLAAGQIHAQGDGPRAYWPAPVGTNFLTPFWMHLDSNRGFDSALIVPEASFDVDILAIMYTRTVSVGGHLGAVSIVVPGGRVEGGLAGTHFQGKSTGLGDIMVFGLVNLYGAPALSPREYQSFTPHTAIDLMLVVTAPTGEYDSSKTVNLGANRWSFRIGAPVLHFFGWGPGQTTSLELIPNVTFFTDNSDPAGQTNQFAQDPLFTLEGHLTHDFNRMWWGSLDALYTAGGETTLDGVAQDNHQRSLALGATLGASLSRTTGVSVSYGGIVDRNDNGMDGSMLRVMFHYIF